MSVDEVQNVRRWSKDKFNIKEQLDYLSGTHAVTQVWARNKSLCGASQEIPWLKGVVDPSTSQFHFSITGLFISTFKKQKYNYSCYNFPWKMKCYVLLALIMCLSLFYKIVIPKWKGLTPPTVLKFKESLWGGRGCWPGKVNWITLRYWPCSMDWPSVVEIQKLNFQFPRVHQAQVDLIMQYTSCCSISRMLIY